MIHDRVLLVKKPGSGTDDEAARKLRILLGSEISGMRLISLEISGYN